jgi:predicted metal-dependent peptidase
LHGGGGTCFQTALNQMLEDRDFNAAAPVVVLTDGYDDYNVAHLGVPCVFVSYGTSFTSDAGPVFVVEK